MSSIVAVVCPFSTGEVLCEQLRAKGHTVVLVFIKNGVETSGTVLHCEFQGDAEVFHYGNVEETAKSLRRLDVEVVLPGAENGVCLADELADFLGLVHNPLEFSKARRNKYMMGERVRASGVRAVKQTIATEWEQVQEFFESWKPSPFKVIVKPNCSAGSEDVFLCESLEEVRAGFDCINGAINELGEVNEGVLVQEFLQGIEYVVDAVSVNGEHKVVAMWKYDKRRANNQFNVYFGTEPCAVSSEIEEAIVEYNNKVLDALQIMHGPSHAEIMLTRDGPCLVEVGARCHGGHGTWIPIANAVFGYNQVDVTIASYLEPEKFAVLPAFPAKQHKYGQEIFLISYEDGVLRDAPGMSTLEKLPSFFAKDLAIQMGNKISKTIDLFTMPGHAQLLHEDQDQVRADYETIHKMLENGEFYELSLSSKFEKAQLGPADDE